MPRYCSNCGAPNESDSRFCTACGYAMKPETILTANFPQGDTSGSPGTWKRSVAESNLQLIAIIEISVGVLVVIMGAFISYILNYIWYIAWTENGFSSEFLRHEQFLGLVQTMIWFLIALIFLYGLLSVLFGIGLWKRRTWGRIGTMIIGALSLVNIPVGTILGIAYLYVLTRPETIKSFERKS